MKLDLSLEREGVEVVGQPIEVDENSTDPGGWVAQAREAAWAMLMFYGKGKVTVREGEFGPRVLSITYEIHDE